MPILFFKTTLPALKKNTTERIEARIQAQEVGVISLVRLSQGDSFWGKLEGDNNTSEFTFNITVKHRVNQ